jgi:hypothetical protein
MLAVQLFRTAVTDRVPGQPPSHGSEDAAEDEVIADLNEPGYSPEPGCVCGCVDA